MNRISRFLCVSILITNLSLADECIIKGGDAFKEARSAGYGFTFKNISEKGECQMGEDAPWFIASASSSTETRCTAVLFSGAGLHSGWRFVRTKINGNITDRKGSQSGSASLQLEFTITAPPSADRKAFLTEVVLAGPNCAKWTDAFSAQQN